MINSGQKISFEDMIALQQDVHDINARLLKPLIIELASAIKHELTSD